MSIDLTNIMNNINAFFVSRNINYVIGGGVGISLLCEMNGIEYPFGISNLDIFYLANTPITPEYIFTYHRMQDCPCTSTTYITEDGFHINLTMIRNYSIRCVKYENFKIMHPEIIQSYYEDEIKKTEIQLEKIFYLDQLIPLITNDTVSSFYKSNQLEQEVELSSTARVLFIS